MRTLILVALVGAVAQLVDGALGMAYGVTSTTLLLTVGLTPAVASASVHLAEVGTTLVSGAAHARFGNVDWRVVGLLGVPGAVAGFLGAVVLSSLSAEAAEPLVAGFLFLMGGYVLARYAAARPAGRPRAGQGLHPVLLAPLGGVAGFLDALGGGGWGPISTTALVASERIEPRRAIGSVDTSEFLVAIASSAGFLVGLGHQQVAWGYVAALLAGGLVAAPIAAYLVSRLPQRLLGAAVGGVLLVTNARTLLGAAGFSRAVTVLAYAAVALTVAAGLVLAFLRHARQRPAAEPTTETAG